MPDPDNPPPNPIPPPTTTSPPNQSRNRVPRRRQNNPTNGPSDNPPSRGGHHGPTNQHVNVPPRVNTDGSVPRRGGARRGRGRGGHSSENQNKPNEGDSDSSAPAAEAGSATQPKHRRKQFGSRLTAEASHSPNSNTTHRPAATKPVDTKDMTLTARLTASFARSASAEDAPDCPICFNTIQGGQPTWSCSPNLEEHGGIGVNCWTTFHLKCIRAWATKRTKETREAFVARNVESSGEWTCPGCQTKRFIVPLEYRCFCSKVVDPRPGRLAIPHSCGDGCSRPRANCEHPCPLSCHPGPCPPCLLTITQKCHCGREVISLRCSAITNVRGTKPNPNGRPTSAPLSCNQPCDRLLDCGKHRCAETCHPGPCGECMERVIAKCYCAKETMDMRCGEGQLKICNTANAGGTLWEGYFECGGVCDRVFDCGKHTCQKGCHPPSYHPPPCPFSPSAVQTCPCPNAVSLISLSALPRTSCSDRIPTCGQTCGRDRDDCEHACPLKCHEGPCPRCEVVVEERCRCGKVGRKRRCWEIKECIPHPDDAGNDEENPELSGIFTCEKKCTATRNCGRHVCGRICCPLAALTSLSDNAKGKRKQKEAPSAEELRELDPEGWHTCDLICNKLLSCGNHNCTENDHRGPCPPCLQSSFEEVVCFCRRTILEPPVPCGTVIRCAYPCTRPPPTCGHPKSPHACHENENGCPPCPFLATKLCACGKTEVRNVRCSQEKVSCGAVCKKPLDCGFHACDKLCHSGDCGNCTQICGKSRRFCLPAHHPCTTPCHAPAACPESTPCNATITLKCGCGRLSRPAICGISSSNPRSKAATSLPCSSECEVAKRNERLAAALGISSDRSSSSSQTGAIYSETLLSFYRSNATFALGAEKTLLDFVTSDKRMLVLPPMPPQRRKFVRELADVYRLNTEEVDQDPRRSVQLLRRIDTRIPNPLLSGTVGKAGGRPTGLVPLRSNVSTPPAQSSTSNTGGSLPVRAGWGAKPPVNTSTPPAIAPKLASMSSTSRPLTPPISSRAAATVVAPHSGKEVAVPDDWEEEDR